ncbi:MAG: hypothetical protein ACYDCP_09940 [Thermoplasmataceae archaeon]
MDTKTPDALIMPEHLKSGARMSGRVQSITRIAEPLLAVNRDAGERAHIRILKGKKLFVTKSPYCSLYFPIWHDREGEPRYTWVTQPDGIKFGFLVDGATAGGEKPEEAEADD